jgi:hypothetical protein
MNIESIAKSLPSIQQLAERYFETFNRAFDKHWTGGYMPAEIEAAGREASGNVLEIRQELYVRLEQLVEFYLSASEVDRDSLRGFLGSFPDIIRALHRYMSWCQERLSGPNDRVYLRRALAACSLGDNRVSFKEMYVALGNLYLASIKVGLNPSMDFVRIANISSPLDRGIGVSMRDFLNDFEESAFFNSDVRPQL